MDLIMSLGDYMICMKFQFKDFVSKLIKRFSDIIVEVVNEKLISSD